MASPIYHRDERVPCNNRNFFTLVEFSIVVARRDPLSETEEVEVSRIANMLEDGTLWPGRGFTLEEDFSDIAQLKLWCRVYFDVAQAIFKREVGCQTNTAWQTGLIHTAMSIAYLFLNAVLETEKQWFPSTEVQREWNSLRLKNE